MEFLFCNTSAKHSWAYALCCYCFAFSLLAPLFFLCFSFLFLLHIFFSRSHLPSPPLSLPVKSFLTSMFLSLQELLLALLPTHSPSASASASTAARGWGWTARHCQCHLSHRSCSPFALHPCLLPAVSLPLIPKFVSPLLCPVPRHRAYTPYSTKEGRNPSGRYSLAVQELEQVLPRAWP